MVLCRKAVTPVRRMHRKGVGLGILNGLINQRVLSSLILSLWGEGQSQITLNIIQSPLLHSSSRGFVS
jgi:hypothetical protein